ncbi:MAG: hypothetical protein ACK4NZ_08700 [Tsuneonella sp.]
MAPKIKLPSYNLGSLAKGEWAMDSEGNNGDKDGFALFVPLMHQIATAVGVKVDKRFDTFDKRLKDEAKFRAVETQTFNPAMASTPLPRAVAKAEAATYDARERAFEAIGKAIAAFLAYSTLKEEAGHKQARLRDYYREMDQAAAVGLYNEAKQFANALREHGVGRWHFRQAGRPQIAIIADLIRWYASDPRLEDPASPWPAIEALYANRTLRKPGDRLGDLEQQSEPGAPPPRGDRRSPDNFYRYGVTPAISSKSAAYPAPAEEEKPLVNPAPTTSPTPVGSPPSAVSLAPVETPAAIEPPVAPATNPREAVGAISRFQTSVTPGPDYRKIAQQLFDADQVTRTIYWSDPALEGEFDPEILIPALKAIIASGRGWSGTEQLLAAALAGNAPEFIAQKQENTIRRWATELEAGEEKMVGRAREAGLL